MALLFVYEAHGDTADLLDRYDQAGPTFKAKGNQLERAGTSPYLAHICVETSDGIRIFDLIESPEVEADAPVSDPCPPGQCGAWLQRHELADQDQVDAIDQAGLFNVHFTDALYRVHNFHVRDSRRRL